MRAEIITVGDEICRGEIVNTNASWLAAALWDLQITVTHISSCQDIAKDMAQCIKVATNRSDLVLMSGGLGPTCDDLTVDVVSQCIGKAVKSHKPSELQMISQFSALGLDLSQEVFRQVRIPASAKAYLNPVGIAPGFEVSLGNSEIFCLPGPPRELKGIFNEHLRDRISALRLLRGENVEYLARCTLRVFGKGESMIADALDGLVLEAGSSLHYQVKFPETLVKLVVRSDSQKESDKILQRIEADVKERLGLLVYGKGPQRLPALVGRLLQDFGQSLATAESCTAGLLGALLTDEPGASHFYLGGVISYANAEKIRQLGVQPETLEAYGAVSEEVAIEMANGVKEKTGADWGVSASGIAGPGGGSTEKPVGTVWVAVSGPGSVCVTKKIMWPSSRERIRLFAAYRVLDVLRRQLVKVK